MTGRLLEARDAIEELQARTKLRGLNSEFAAKRDRLHGWLLSPSDAAACYRLWWDFSRKAGALGPDVTPQSIAELLLAALDLGPDPGRSIDDAGLVAAQAMIEVENARKQRVKNLKVQTLGQIMRTDFPPLRAVVRGLFYEGLTVLAAPAKTGKTFFGLELAGAVAQGHAFLGHFATEKTGVLYLFLEGGSRSIKARARHIELPEAENVHIAQEWARGPAALADVAAFLQENPRIGLVILDTFEIVREPPSRGTRTYSDEYVEIREWNDLALKTRTCIVAISHTRKGLDESGDFANESYGSGGLTGGCSGIIHVRRVRGADRATLKATFREAPEVEATLAYANGRWSWTEEDPRDAERTPERAEVLGILRDSTTPMKPSEIAAALGKTRGNISMSLARLKADGDVETCGYGLWRVTKGCDTSDSVTLIPPQSHRVTTVTGGVTPSAIESSSKKPFRPDWQRLGFSGPSVGQDFPLRQPEPANIEGGLF